MQGVGEEREREGKGEVKLVYEKKRDGKIKRMRALGKEDKKERRLGKERRCLCSFQGLKGGDKAELKGPQLEANGEERARTQRADDGSTCIDLLHKG
jgi:hypothetical protein